MKPLISVIIPTFNYARFLPEAIKSVQRQSEGRWELIIVDDGSTDQTREIVIPHLKDGQIIYLYQKNRGLPAARNAGLAKARGDLIAFLDADDLYLPDKLAKQVSVLQRQPEYGLTYSDVRYFYDDKKNQLFSRKYPRYYGNDSIKILQQNFIPSTSPLIRRECFDKAGFFNERSNFAEDWEMWIRMALVGIQFHYLDEVLCLVRIHGKQLLSFSQGLHQRNLQLVDEVRRMIDSRQDKSLLREWQIMKSFVNYQTAGTALVAGTEESSARIKLAIALPTMLNLDKRRLVRGILCLFYSFIPRKFRLLLSKKTLFLVNPYNRF